MVQTVQKQIRRNTKESQVEHPILFSAPMIRAILNNTKYQTRQPIKPQPVIVVDDGEERWRFAIGKGYCSWDIDSRPRMCALDGMLTKSPFGKPGDILWVRETWQAFNKLSGSILTNGIPKVNYGGGFWVAYKADNIADPKCKWKPSIHMPKWACRLRLTVKRVWVERVQDISWKDIIAEGCDVNKPTGDPAIDDFTAGTEAFDAFRFLWNSIYGPDAWDRNDWVFCGEYEAVK